MAASAFTLGAMPNASAPDMNAISDIANTPATRPLDQNGVDVYGELPYMKAAYGLTANGQAERGTQEAMYALVKNQDGPSRTKVMLGGNRQSSLTVPARTMAIVHTHPAKAAPQPGHGDADMNVPNYVYSGNKLFVTVPHSSKFYEYNINDWGQQK